MKKRIEQIATKRGYVVTEEGKLLNPKGEEIGSINNTGYIKTSIRVNKKKVSFMSHRLQAFQKYGDKLYDKGVEVRHKNGNPLDNSWNNILIGTHSENMQDIPEQIRIKKAKHAASFLKKHNKEKIQKFHKENKSYKLTMEKFNISSKGTLWHILNK